MTTAAICAIDQAAKPSRQVTDTYEYDAFGNRFTVSGSTPNNYLYRGEQFDPDLGLYYLRARYYNPATGRFMSRDPKNGELTDPQSLHKYLYAGADPIDRIDPQGREFLADYDVQAAINNIVAQTARFIAVQVAPRVVIVAKALAPAVAAIKAFCWAESALAYALTKAGHKTDQPDPEAGLCLLLGP